MTDHDQQNLLHLVDATLSGDEWYRLEMCNDVLGERPHRSEDEPFVEMSLQVLVNFRARTLLGWASFRQTTLADRGGVDTPPPAGALAQHGSSVFTEGLDEPGVEPLRVAGFASSVVAPVYWLRGVGEASREARLGQQRSEGDPGVGEEGEEVWWYEAWVDPTQAVERSPGAERAAVRESLEHARLGLDEKVRVNFSTTLVGQRITGVEVSLPSPTSSPAATWRLRLRPAPRITVDIGAALTVRSVREVVEEFVGVAP